jgi:hypothetical protein
MFANSVRSVKTIPYLLITNAPSVSLFSLYKFLSAGLTNCPRLIIIYNDLHDGDIHKTYKGGVHYLLTGAG